MGGTNSNIQYMFPIGQQIFRAKSNAKPAAPSDNGTTSNALNTHSSVFAHAFTDANVDCWFRLANESGGRISEIAAHQTVLAAVSPVFRAMFSGTWNDDVNRVAIEDSTYELFAAFKEFIYKDAVALTVKNAVGILHLADKYDVQPMVDQCEAFMVARLSVDNVAAYYPVAVRYERDQLRTKCHQLFRCRYHAVLESGTLLDFDQATLAAFLRQLPHWCNMVRIFDACIRWSEARCEEDGIKHPEMGRLRSTLGECFGLMHFKAMDHGELIDRYRKYKKMFTREERDDIFDHLPIKRRTAVPMDRWVFTFGGIYLNDQVDNVYGGINFKLSKPLSLHSLVATETRRDNRIVDFSATIAVTQGNRELLVCDAHFASADRVFELPKEVVIEAGIVHAISIVRKGNDRITVTGCTHKRRQIYGVDFVPIERECGAESASGIFCSIESFKFLSLAEC